MARLSRTVWASEVRVAGTTPDVAVMLCHPTANFLGHYALAGLAERGFGAIGFTTRYVGNDTSLIMENCLLDMGAMVRYLYERGYDAVVLVGNSGGASIVPYYQAQARQPTITDPPGGGPDLTAAALRAVDAIVMLNAHPSRATLSTEWLDPAIVDEGQAFAPRPVVGHVQPGERAALLAGVRLSLPGGADRSQQAHHGLGTGAAGRARHAWPRSARSGGSGLRRPWHGGGPALPRWVDRSQRSRGGTDPLGSSTGGQLHARRHQPGDDVAVLDQPVVDR